MKKFPIFAAASMLCLAPLFTSCGENDEEVLSLIEGIQNGNGVKANEQQDIVFSEDADYGTLTEDSWVASGEVEVLNPFVAIAYASYNKAKVPEGSKCVIGVACSETNEEPTTKDKIVTFTGDTDGNHYAVVLKQLKPATTYYYRAYITVDKEETVYGETRTFTTEDFAVTTSTAEAFGAFAEKMSGTVSMDKLLGVGSYEIGVCYNDKETTLPTTKDKVLRITELDEANGYSVVVSPLEHGKTYYYRTYITVDKVVYYSEVASFTTEAFAVSNSAGEAAGAFTANLTGVLDMSKLQGVSYELNVIYSKKNTYDLKKDKIVRVTEVAEDGSYSVSLRFLEPTETYNYWTYVTVDKQQCFCEESQSVTTAPFTGIITGDAAEVLTWDAALNGSIKHEELVGYESDFVVGVVYSNAEDEADPKVGSTSKKCTNVSVGNIAEETEYTAAVTDLKKKSTYNYRAYLQLNDGKTSYYYYGDVQTFTTLPITPVDLGLSVKWCPANAGADAPAEPGNYYAWGETTSKTDYSWKSYLLGLGGSMTSFEDCGTEKDPLRDYVGLNGKSISNSEEYDAALATSIAKGDNEYAWRMPTKEEQDELRANCDWEWTQFKGVNGYMVTSKKNGNQIFLPAAGYSTGKSATNAGQEGYYWSATPQDYQPYDAYYIFFCKGKVDWYSYYDRCIGLSVRAVSDDDIK